MMQYMGPLFNVYIRLQFVLYENSKVYFIHFADSINIIISLKRLKFVFRSIIESIV